MSWSQWSEHRPDTGVLTVPVHRSSLLRSYCYLLFWWWCWLWLKTCVSSNSYKDNMMMMCTLTNMSSWMKGWIRIAPLHLFSRSHHTSGGWHINAALWCVDALLAFGATVHHCTTCIWCNTSISTMEFFAPMDSNLHIIHVVQDSVGGVRQHKLWKKSEHLVE